MDRSDVITLIGETLTQNSYGVWESTETKTDVYCQVDSISQSEFFEAGRNGINPQYRFRMFFGDYNNETIVEYRGLRYGVYRTYQGSTDTLELYVERKGGTNVEKNNS